MSFSRRFITTSPGPFFVHPSVRAGGRAGLGSAGRVKLFATENLWRSLLAGDHDSLLSIETEPGALDVILPWRWPRRRPECLRAIRRALHLDALGIIRPRAILWSVVFAILFNVATVLNEVNTK